MRNFIIGKVLVFLGKKLDGRKTLIGGIGAILFGVAGLINCIWPGTIPGINLDFDTAIGSILAGFGALGIGGKLEKLKGAANGQGTTGSDQPATQGTGPAPGTDVSTTQTGA